MQRGWTHRAVRDPLLVAVLLGSPQLLGQLTALYVGVELRHRAQHDHLYTTHATYKHTFNPVIITAAVTTTTTASTFHDTITTATVIITIATVTGGGGFDSQPRGSWFDPQP